MLHRSAWLRRLAGVVAWTAVTSVAAVGTWLSLAVVLPVGADRIDADTVVSSTSDNPSTVPSPSPATSPKPEEAPPETETETERTPSPTEESPPPQKHDGWEWVAGDTYEGRFTTEGGTAVIQVDPSDAVLVSASPVDGFTADVEQVGANRLVIDFYDDNTQVTIDAMWWDGPYAEISTLS
ncbi:MAG TPA: hypothetical protein H9881_14250 [Candidatus Stackebrandtia excrementipullorum]|nr:hypothetical protein [Candidatus Stackebrandtia excrementipullorum]